MRSMATRGVMGGLARSTLDVVLLLDAFGKEVIMVETVGVGQDEVEIARAADSTVVVGVPNLGDDIQAIKAGILEIADVLVVNKADLSGADRLVADLRTMLQLGSATPAGSWTPPIVQTVATEGKGVPELVDSLAEHRAYLDASGTWRTRRAESAWRQVRAIVEDRVQQHEVAPGTHGQEEVGGAGNRSQTRINDDNPGTVVPRPPDVVRQNGKALPNIDPGQDETLGQRDVAPRLSSAVDAKRHPIRGPRRHHAEAPIVIDMLRAQGQAGKLANQIRLLVGKRRP